MSEAIENTAAEAAEIIEETQEKPYTLRELCDEDLYTVLAILGEIIPDDAKKTFVQAVSGKATLDFKGKLVAFDMCRVILKNMGREEVKVKVYAFLSDLSGIPAAEIRKMPFGTTPAMVKEIFEDAKNVDFFKGLLELF